MRTLILASALACVVGFTQAYAADNKDANHTGGAGKGAAVGALAGHEMGSGHAAAGAATGAAVGHHDKKKAEESSKKDHQE